MTTRHISEITQLVPTAETTDRRANQLRLIRFYLVGFRGASALGAEDLASAWLRGLAKFTHLALKARSDARSSKLEAR